MKVAETLWLSVADEVKMPIPSAHKKVIDTRLAKYRNGASAPVAHKDMMARLRAK